MAIRNSAGNIAGFLPQSSVAIVQTSCHCRYETQPVAVELMPRVAYFHCAAAISTAVLQQNATNQSPRHVGSSFTDTDLSQLVDMHAVIDQVHVSQQHANGQAVNATPVYTAQ